jgi:predicted acylesterase/phospholipase RssA
MTEKEKTEKMYDVLVISGTSSKCIITLGALQYIYDNFLSKSLKTFIGTSSGSIICYLLIIGYTPMEIMVYICTNQLFEKMQEFNIVALVQGKGAISYNYIHEQLEKMSIKKIGYLPTLLDLKEKYNKELVCVTHNLTQKKTEYLSWKTNPSLPCVNALRMSSNLPLIFEQYKYGKDLYIDGGISNNFAIDVAHEYGEKILAIFLENNDKNDITDMNTIEYIYKLMFIPITQRLDYKLKYKKDLCKIVKLVDNTELRFFNFGEKSKVKLEMFSNGYNQISKIL